MRLKCELGVQKYTEVFELVDSLNRNSITIDPIGCKRTAEALPGEMWHNSHCHNYLIIQLHLYCNMTLVVPFVLTCLHSMHEDNVGWL